MDYPRDFVKDDLVWRPRSPTPSIQYSDGAYAEVRLKRILDEATDRTVLSRQLATAAVDWPSLYHLSPRRANLLRPLSLTTRMSILEIGAGCGALTRFLGESGAHVVAIEGSLARAQIAAARTQDLDNVEILFGTFGNINFASPFDLVVIVGVLEYAAMYSEAVDPFLDLLTSAASHLTVDGALALAIENRLGLKYWSGVPEDHTGYSYMGVMNTYETGGPRTFGEQELTSLLADAGLVNHRTLVPVPDYKLVRSVIDFHSLPCALVPAAQHIVAAAFHEDAQIRAPTAFSLELAAVSAIENGLGTQLANSFLVIAAADAASLAKICDPETCIWHFATSRIPSFAKATLLQPRSTPITVRRAHLADPSADGRSGHELSVTQTLLEEPFRNGRSVWLQLVASLNSPGWTADGAAATLYDWYRAVTSLADGSGNISGGLLDATPYNALLCRGNVEFIDQEWLWHAALPVSWVARRGLIFSLDMITSVAEAERHTPVHIEQLVAELLTALGSENGYRSEDREAFLEWLTTFHATVAGSSLAVMRTHLEGILGRHLLVRDEPPRASMLEEPLLWQSFG